MRGRWPHIPMFAASVFSTAVFKHPRFASSPSSYEKEVLVVQLDGAMGFYISHLTFINNEYASVAVWIQCTCYYQMQHFPCIDHRPFEHLFHMVGRVGDFVCRIIAMDPNPEETKNSIRGRDKTQFGILKLIAEHREKREAKCIGTAGVGSLTPTQVRKRPEQLRRTVEGGNAPGLTGTSVFRRERGSSGRGAGRKSLVASAAQKSDCRFSFLG